MATHFMDRTMTRDEIAGYCGAEAQPTRRGAARDGRRRPRPPCPENLMNKLFCKFCFFIKAS